MSSFFCPWESAQYLIISSSVPHILYYAMIPGMVVAVLLSAFVFFYNKKNLSSFLLLTISACFFVWGFLNLILFATNDPHIVIVLWSYVILVEPLIYAASLYLSYVFFTKNDVSFSVKLIMVLLLSPFILLLASHYNLSGVNVSDCTALEGPVALYFTYAVEFIFSIWILILSIIKYRANSDRVMKKQIILFTFGILFFLLVFSSGNIIGSFMDDWVMSQYGYFGMPVFIGFLGYLIVKYKAFNVKLLAAQGLVLVIFILIASQFAFIRNNTNRFLTAITLVLVTASGYLLVRSVKKEIQAREEIAKLADDLKKTNINLDNANDNLKSKNEALDNANGRLKELDQQKTDFLSIAAHQLRTPLSISKGYLELLEDGGYGKPPKDMLPIFSNMDEANERLIKMIDGFLDVSRIEQGRTKFDFKVESLSDVITEAVNELKPRAADKGLDLVWAPDKTLKTDANLDHEKIRHVIFNFIDNAIKYSDKGKIKVALEKDGFGLKVNVVDDGLGFGKEDEGKFFQRYTRGQNVKGINVTGTGIGLFVCRKFVEEHKGKVWSKSKGLGKGSDFGFWIPVK